VPRQNCINNLGHHRVVKADYTRENTCVVALTQAVSQVVAKFVFHATVMQALFRKLAPAQFA
jgi:hypothetical protein